jgi:PhzF family phenazine biosynthesis protein
MRQTIVQVDAFTNVPFAGNPAAVCVLPGPRDEVWMQRMAREMNLSETAFLYRETDGRPDPSSSTFRLRWFTPEVEVDLCGHATLATAHVLWTEGHLALDAPAQFQTRSGRLTAERTDGWITLDLPALRLNPEPLEIDPIASVLGSAVTFAARGRFDILAEVESEAALLALKPDFGRMRAYPVRGLIVTARASRPGFDFVSRFFAPAVGIDEDPVCGSAHCCLGPFWGERLRKSDMLAYQASPRGGVLRVGLRGDRIALGGQAVSVLKGELLDSDQTA